MDTKALQRLQWKVMENVAAAALVPLMRLGDELDLFPALARCGPATAEDFAASAKIDARYALEWLSAMAAAGFVTYDEGNDTFALSEEQAAVFADTDSPALMIGAYDLLTSAVLDEPKVRAIFPTGEGLAWGEHHPCCFRGTARFFKPAYQANLVERWLPAIEGAVAKLEAGGKFGDIGCGHGISTMMIAEAFPEAEVVGYDVHPPSIEAARQLVADAGLAERVRFEVATAKEVAEDGFDILAFFDCLHDMGDPVGAARHANDRLKPDGLVMLIEPFANDRLADNLNVVGQMMYSFSTMACVPGSRAQEVGLGLGAQAGPARLTEVLNQAGFGTVRIADTTATNLVIEARR